MTDQGGGVKIGLRRVDARVMSETDEVARLQAIIQTQSVIAGHLHDPGRVMELVMAAAADLVGADGAIVGVIEDDDMAYRAVSGIVDGMLGVRLDVDAGLAGLAIAEGAPLRCDDTLTDDRVDHEECRRAGIRSAIAFPLMVDAASPLGVFTVVSAQPDAFSDRDVETLGGLARYIAVSIRQATDWEAVDRRVRRDPLTGVANRAAVLERLHVWMAEDGRDGAVTLHFVVIDGFELLLDTMGATAADRRLKEVAAALNSGVRSDDLVGRLRGDEFVVVCRHIDTEDADRMGERLKVLAKGSVVVARSRPGETAEELVRRADETSTERSRLRRDSETSAAEAGT